MIEKILDNFPFYFILILISASIAWSPEGYKVVTCLFWIIVILIQILIKLYELNERGKNDRSEWSNQTAWDIQKETTAGKETQEEKVL